MLIGITVSSLFDLMPALGTNVVTILIGRFFGGLFGAAPVAIFGGVLSDCWPLAHRGIAMALAVSLVFSGPTWGPVFGGFIMCSPSLDWRWNMWVVVIIGLGASLLCIFVYPETYPPAILRAKARALRRRTGNPNIETMSDKEGFSIREITRVYLIRPFRAFSESYHPVVKSLHSKPLTTCHDIRVICNSTHPRSSDLIPILCLRSHVPILPNLPCRLWRRS